MTALRPPHGLAGAFLAALCLALPAAPGPASCLEIRGEDGTPLIRGDQIRSYEWATHTLTLAPKVREELVSRLHETHRLVSGVPFAVTVEGKVVYRGVFTSMLSSHSFAMPVVLVDRHAAAPKLGPEQLRIQLGYPGAQTSPARDPRADPRIRAALEADGKLPGAGAEHTEWVARSLREIATIRPGMTRLELLAVFRTEGGLSTRTQRRYVYRQCPYFKVDVTFDVVGAPADKWTESPRDRISRISRPFLEHSILD